MKNLFSFKKLKFPTLGVSDYWIFITLSFNSAIPSFNFLCLQEPKKNKFKKRNLQ